MAINLSFDENQIDALESLNVFMALAGEKFAPYATENVIDDNLKTLYEWGAANLPGGVLAFKQTGAYEIAFAQTTSILKRDPNFKTKAEQDAEFAKYFESETAEKSRERYFSDPAFARYIDGR